MEKSNAAASDVHETSIMPLNSVVAESEIDVQVSTARRFPRSLRTFEQNALTRATLSQEVAQSCYYMIPRDGKMIEGPSIRLAEICAGAWQNLRWGGKVIAVEDKNILCEGFCWDLENNLAVKVEVRRKITNKKGARYSDDMVTVTGNAGTAIAMRNAVFKVIPKNYTDKIMARIKQVAAGDARTLVANRDLSIDIFAKMKVSKDALLKLLGKKAVEDINLEDLATLRGVYTAIKDGDTTVAEVFPEPMPMPKRASESAKPEGAPASPKEGEALPVEVPPPPSPPIPTGIAPPSPRIDRLKGLCKERGVSLPEFDKQVFALFGSMAAAAEQLMTPDEENVLHAWIMNKKHGGK